jgi:hypothetical protein
MLCTRMTLTIQHHVLFGVTECLFAYSLLLKARPVMHLNYKYGNKVHGSNENKHKQFWLDVKVNLWKKVNSAHSTGNRPLCMHVCTHV